MPETGSTPPTIRVGTVPFLNAAPLTHGLDDVPGVSLVRRLPAPLSASLARGELDVALVPSAALLRLEGFSLLPVAAIGSDGPVRSVRLFHRKPPGELRRVALDSGSVTSAALARLVLRRAYDARPEFVPHEPTLAALEAADAVLIIGDAALVAEREAARRAIPSLDLGAAWREITSLPFTWAVFALRDGAPGGAAVTLAAARDRGLAARNEIAASFARDLGLDARSLEDYLERNIRFAFGERELRGLLAFRDALHEEGLLDAAREVRLAPAP
jgi:chorismate dehydratase